MRNKRRGRKAGQARRAVDDLVHRVSTKAAGELHVCTRGVSAQLGEIGEAQRTLWLDGDTLGMDCAEVRVGEEVGEAASSGEGVRQSPFLSTLSRFHRQRCGKQDALVFGRLLEGLKRRSLPAHRLREVVADLAAEALEAASGRSSPVNKDWREGTKRAARKEKRTRTGACE